MEGDGQRGAAADAQSYHGRGLWGTCAGAKRLVSTSVLKATIFAEANRMLAKAHSLTGSSYISH